MRINADFSKKAVVVPDESGWVRSPESGVDRLMLDRIGDEVARATSIVRYAPASSFPGHEHAAGEEFLVLEGVFSDERGDYRSGTYVRNPPGSRHAPHSVEGCRIFVKLRQFDPLDLSPVVIDTAQGAGDSVELHRFRSERVRMIRVRAGERFPVRSDPGGIEILVVRGSISDGGTELPAESWLRLPAGHRNDLRAASDSVLWVKTGHLPS